MKVYTNFILSQENQILFVTKESTENSFFEYNLDIWIVTMNR